MMNVRSLFCYKLRLKWFHYYKKQIFLIQLEGKKGKELPRKTVIKDNQVFRLFTVPSPSNQALTGQGHIPVIQ